jgi:hypothetical protein
MVVLGVAVPSVGWVLDSEGDLLPFLHGSFSNFVGMLASLQLYL